jgi:hypothetical protein
MLRRLEPEIQIFKIAKQCIDAPPGLRTLRSVPLEFSPKFFHLFSALCERRTELLLSFGCMAKPLEQAFDVSFQPLKV